ncbi:MAG: class I SAM-dependent rRNA methyltransferase [Anaerolineae bacterium]|nr:class I SAM-dependent rRNA methyltransferase [Anaerolineae bacterium]
MSSPTLILRPGREKPILQQHPWVYSGAIERVAGDPEPGEIVTLVTSRGEFAARGYWNPRSMLQARLLTWRDEPINEAWWSAAFARAIAARRPWLDAGLPCRLVHAESDFLPGLVVDVYPDTASGERWAVLQALTLGIEARKDELAAILLRDLGAAGVYDRSDVDIRKKEGLGPQKGLLAGRAAPENRVQVRESAGFALTVDLLKGHKTGHYLDQQANHALLRDLIIQRGPEQRLLNLFSYTGSFGLAALAGGAAHITNVDSSQGALDLAEASRANNGYNAASVASFTADAFQFLRAAEESGDRWDVIICDPPKFAHTHGQVERAARGYKDLNLRCFRLIEPGGLIMTFSCSGAITRDLFHKIVFGALVDSGRQAQIVRELSAGDDHPVALTFPEGEYLKGLLLRVY